MWPWPMTLKFNRALEVVEVHVHAKFNQAECSGSWVIGVMEKKTQMNKILSVATDDSAHSEDLVGWLSKV